MLKCRGVANLLRDNAMRGHSGVCAGILSALCFDELNEKLNIKDI